MVYQICYVKVHFIIVFLKCTSYGIVSNFVFGHSYSKPMKLDNKQVCHSSKIIQI